MTTTPSPFQEPSDFSLVLGGPLYQLYRKTYLSGPILELVLRRVLLFALIAWVTLFLLCLYGGQLFSNGHLGFLRDLETHVRFLVALPVLIGAEIIVHKRTRTVKPCSATQTRHDGVPLWQWGSRQAAMCSTALRSPWRMQGRTGERKL